MKVYKIVDGMGNFSKGGVSPTFNKKGKVWRRVSDLTAHLNDVRLSVYESRGVGIVEYEVTETPLRGISIEDWMKGAGERKKNRQLRSSKRLLESARQEKLAELDRIQRRLEEIQCDLFRVD